MSSHNEERKRQPEISPHILGNPFNAGVPGKKGDVKGGIN
jgi:hypothetical protein